jgi:hypothetical protein
MRPTALLIVLLYATAVYAQKPVEQPKFALEMSEDGFPPHYLIVDQGKIFSIFNVSGSPNPYFHPLPKHDAGNTETIQPSALNLVCNLNGDAISITASVVFGALDQNEIPLLEGHSQQTLGAYSVHMNESIVLGEMEKFGLQPWTIRMVNAQLAAPATLPGLNKVPSIQSQILGKDRQGYRIALRNVSPRGVTAFSVETTYDHSSRYSETSYHSPLIAPGAIHEFRLFCDTSTGVATNPAAGEPPPCAFILEAALFSDGTYEGDPGAATDLAVRPIAERFQRRRVLALVQRILAEQDLEDTAKLSRIRSELAELKEESDPAILEELRLQFPQLPSVAGEPVDSSVRSTFAMERQSVLRGMTEFERLREQNPAKSLAQWWSDWARTQ